MAGREVDETARRYDRNAGVYDFINSPMEWFGVARMRHRLFARARGVTLEAGVGTGRSFDDYPPDIALVGIDVSQRMLARAARRAAALGRAAKLELADVQRLPFPDASFDTATAACVFCSVPDPVAGLRELSRIVRPGGQVLLLEHVRPANAILGALFDLMSILTRRLFGYNTNRRTEENVTAAGLRIVEVRRSGVWREIVAIPEREPIHPPTPTEAAPK